MDLHGIAAEILGPEEDPRDGEPDNDAMDVGLITAAEELMAALKPSLGEDPRASDVARKLCTFVEMCLDSRGE